MRNGQIGGAPGSVPLQAIVGHILAPAYYCLGKRQALQIASRAECSVEDYCKFAQLVPATEEIFRAFTARGSGQARNLPFHQ